MGYTTEFKGEFKVTPSLKPEHAAYLRKFAETRRMKRDAEKAAALRDPEREAVGLDVGLEGAYLVGGGGVMGQGDDPSIVNYNQEPEGQPGLWCKWAPNDEGTAIEWNGYEKFYKSVPWLRYLVEHFLARWGYVLDGEVKWQGEDIDDRGKITVIRNEITVVELE